MLFNWLKDRRRSKLAAETFPAAWLQIVHHNCRHFATLDPGEQARLLRDVRWFLDEKSIETAIGLKLTDEMRVTVAAHASLLGLGFEAPPFDRLRSVIIRADSYLGTQIQRGSSGLELHSETARIGETTRNGPVLLSWRDVEQQCRDAPYGRNVILHEFAHLLDMVDGDVDGVPPLQNEEQYKTWKDVTRIEYHRLVNEAQFGIPSLLDWYGATNEAEFFAVATESFFEQPTEMRKLHPRLYDVLRVFYKQDPANRWMRNVA
jgi:Mlc titration factor MtfA (ptsG expression regulator)